MAAGGELIARCQQAEALIEAPGDVSGGHPAHPRGGELDRKWYVIEALADFTDRALVLGVE